MLHTTVRIVAAGAVIVALAQPTREQVVETVRRIQRADYEGNRDALRTLAEALAPRTRDRQLDSRVYYWRGFALWRRAFNGFNQNAATKDLAADLERAVTQFEHAVALDPAFADAKIGMVSCLQNLAFIHRDDTAATAALVARFVPLIKELAAQAPENPRFLWLYGASLWYALPGLTDAQIATRRAQALATYERGLKLARTSARPPDPIEPSWGEPELLMNLAWSHLHAATPDLAAAETYAAQSLTLVPYWQYMRDILMPQIRHARGQQRLDLSFRR
jgi:hypothetical protein